MCLNCKSRSLVNRGLLEGRRQFMHQQTRQQRLFPRNIRTAMWLAVLFLWLVSAGSGMALLARYSSQAGELTSPPERIASTREGSSRPFRLMMFAHPHCPCTSASLRELARLMSRRRKEIDATVYFYTPADKPAAWAMGRLWNVAARIPGVRVEVDSDGRVARQFRSKTSGEIVLYDAMGHLRFHGGITQGRGHEGESRGKMAIMSLVKGEGRNVEHCPVFGCPIRSTPLSVPDER
jgi:hypothetical protein